MTLDWKSKSVLQLYDYSNLQLQNTITTTKNKQNNALIKPTPIIIINNMKLSISLVLVLLFCCMSSLGCVTNAESYYYSDENGKCSFLVIFIEFKFKNV